MSHRLEALARANDIRVWRKEQRLEIAGGNLERAFEVLLSADSRLDSLLVVKFLDWLPYVGQRRSKLIAQEALLYRPLTRTIGSLRLEEVYALVGTVRRYFEDRDHKRAA